MKREMVCIICPKGCALTAQIQDSGVKVSGNGCSRGAEYAKSECLNPVRTVTTTVRVANRPDTMVSVKTESPVAKSSMEDVVKAIRSMCVYAPVCVGDVLESNVCGSRILITKAVE